MSDIEWTDETWNPMDGCKVCSPGCANCYAMRFAGRFSKPGERYHGLVTVGKNKRAVWTGEVMASESKLAKPLFWKKPRRVFVNSMSDLFYEGFTDEQIAAVFGVMAACPQHTFQILTKRAERMRAWFEWAEQDGDKQDLMRFGPSALTTQWPLRNVHLGVSVENQYYADERIPELLAAPAAVRFISAEPLLGDIDLFAFLKTELRDRALRAQRAKGPLPGLDWVIAGCESGPRPRPCATSYLRSLRDRCAEANVPFFLKQAHPWTWVAGEKPPQHDCDPDGAITLGAGSELKAGGVIGLPYLDGKQHKEMPRCPT